jgi:hypothetical protein
VVDEQELGDGQRFGALALAGPAQAGRRPGVGAGAKGYLLKQITGEDLVRQLERVAEGETVIDAGLAGRAVVSAARLRGGEFWPGEWSGSL